MTEPPAHGSVVLREFTEADVRLALELGEDPYIPLIGSLPAHPTRRQAEEWVRRQQSGRAEGRGYPFVIVADGAAVGTIGLWLRKLSEGIGILGYSISPERCSLRAAEKAGFRCEGLLPAHHEIGGVLKDMLLYVSP
ncbi:GNAT family N-acetyltransferase [Amycolatopsis sp. WAC 04169]|uniref:GNAT family N-acetyltransferase n=1 Tax=Amycolatopsis sp. WAC 04169 TaxID=2203197 RepID=UPI001F1A6A4F|nr:GNAT family N-acetyltransferase [Amycolatopsis sp. WAC 04169]